MAQKHGTYYEGEQNISPKIEQLRDKSTVFAEGQKKQTQGLTAGSGNTFINAISGSLGVVKGFFDMIGMLFLVAPALAQALYLPSEIGQLINAAMIFTITYLVIKFLFGRSS